MPWLGCSYGEDFELEEKEGGRDFVSSHLFRNLDIFKILKEATNPLLDFRAEQGPFESDFHSSLRGLPLAAWQAR